MSFVCQLCMDCVCSFRYFRHVHFLNTNVFSWQQLSWAGVIPWSSKVETIALCIIQQYLATRGYLHAKSVSTWNGFITQRKACSFRQCMHVVEYSANKNYRYINKLQYICANSDDHTLRCNKKDSHPPIYINAYMFVTCFKRNVLFTNKHEKAC